MLINLIFALWGSMMRNKNALWMVLLALGILLPTLVRAEAPLAVVLSCQGEVAVVKSEGESVKALFGMPLESGDEVRTGKNSGAEILFENGNWIEVGASSSMVIKVADVKKSASVVPTSSRSFKTVQNFLKLRDPAGTSSLAELRSIDRNVELVAESPSQTKISGDHPTFRWKTLDPSTELRLILYNEEGIHWEQKVKDAGSLEYPDDAPALESGITYSWIVETTDPLQFPPLRSPAAFFEILSASERNELNVSLEQITRQESIKGATYHILRASLFFDFGLVQDAIDETMEALEFKPEDSTLHYILARLYVEAGRSKEAVDLYDRLLKGP